MTNNLRSILLSEISISIVLLENELNKERTLNLRRSQHPTNTKREKQKSVVEFVLANEKKTYSYMISISGNEAYRGRELIISKNVTKKSRKSSPS